MTGTLARWLLPCLAAFLLVLVVRLPAAWLRPLLPAQLVCTDLDGTVWRGECRGVRIGIDAGHALAAERLAWVLRPAALLSGRAGARLELYQAGHGMAGQVELGVRRLHLERLSGSLPTDARQLPLVPQGWQGELFAQDFALTLQAGHFIRLQGEAGIRAVQDPQGNALGSYRVQFPDPGPPPFRGQLVDIDGPLAVHADVQVSSEGTWQIEGRIMPRASAPPALATQLSYLGLPAADGSYPFSLAGE